MSKPKVEVGQVWEQDGFTYLVVWVWSDNVAYYDHTTDEVETDSTKDFLAGECLLIQNADGTPVKQWRRVTAKELLLEGFSEVPLPCQVRDSDQGEWKDVELISVGLYQGFVTRRSFWEQCRIEVKA